VVVIAVGFKSRNTGVKKPVTGDLKSINLMTIIIIIISHLSWYRYSICKNGKNAKWSVTT
jgi:hypothetical protein